MYTTLFTLAASLFSPTAASPTPNLSTRQTTDPANCASLHVITIRGRLAGDPIQFFDQTVPIITGAVPGSEVYGLPYDSGDTDIITNVNNGTVMLKEYIMDYAESCPNSKIGILGYSDGATATMNMLCGTSSLPYLPVLPLPDRYAQQVVATVVWGDLTRDPFQPWNKGTCPADGGISYTSRVDNLSCAPYSDNLASYCDVGDQYCCGFPQMNDAHHTYQNFYTQDTADFIIDGYHRAGGS